MTGATISSFRYLLLAATAAMFVLHLASGVLLRRGIRAVTLLRFEGAYYAVILAALAVPAFRGVLWPAMVLAALHFAAWAYSEARPEPGVPRRSVLMAVQIFDWAEAIALAWMALRLA